MQYVWWVEEASVRVGSGEFGVYVVLIRRSFWIWGCFFF